MHPANRSPEADPAGASSRDGTAPGAGTVTAPTGVIDDTHLVFVVVDGRQEGYSEGVTLPELADIMLSLGATTAYNLDGGGSSTMYFDGRVVDSPSNGGERGTSDILYVAS